MNNIVPLRAGAIPAAFANRANLPDMNAAAQQGLAASFAIIGYKGRNWRIKHRGEEELLKDPRSGAPVPSLDVVIVGISPFISKQFYEKRYSEGDDAAPDCYSVNGIAPEIDSPKRQCETCAACPQNVYGSRVTDGGKKAKACQDSRRLAVVPAGDVVNESYGGPMLLRLPPMSLAGLAKYSNELARFAAQPYMVSTVLSFDYDVAYPLLTFKADGWLDDAQAMAVAEVMENPLIPRMLETAAAEEATKAQEDVSALAGGRPSTAFAGAKAPVPSTATPAPSTPAPAATESPAARKARELREQLAQMEAEERAEEERAAQAAQAAPAGQPEPEPEPEDEDAAALRAAEEALAAARARAAAKTAKAAEAAATTAVVPATPPKKASPFGGKGGKGAAAPVAAAAEPEGAAENPASTTAQPPIAAAPADLESAIDALLA